MHTRMPTPSCSTRQYRSLSQFFKVQEERLLEPVGGTQMTVVRIIMNTLKRCTERVGATFQQENLSIGTPLRVTLNDSARRQLLESTLRLRQDHPAIFARLSECEAMVRDTIMQVLAQSESSVVIGPSVPEENTSQASIILTPIAAVPYIDDTEHMRHDPLSTLAPLDSPPSAALQCATDLVSETFAASGSGRADIAALYTTLDAQSLLRAETQDECIEAFEVLARDFPALMPEIHALYRSLIDTATTLYTTLRASALQPTSHAEFVRYLAVLHSAMSDALSDCDMMTGAAGLKQHFAELLMTSVTQSLAMARVLHAEDAESYCTMLPEGTPIEHMRPKEKNKLKARYEKANQSWRLCFAQWRQSLECMTAAGQDSSQIRTCTHMMNGVFSSVDWLYSYYRATDATVVSSTNDTPTEPPNHCASSDLVPAFSAIVSHHRLFSVAGTELLCDRSIDMDTLILRHLTYKPGSLPALTVHHKNGTSKRIVECWMCLPDGPISSPQNVIPLTTICDGMNADFVKRLSQFAMSIERSARTERKNIKNNDVLAPYFPKIRQSDKSLVTYHDPMVYAVLAPADIATGPLSNDAIFDEIAAPVIEHMMKVSTTMPSFKNPEEPPALIHVEVFDATEAPNEEHLDRKRVSTFCHTRTVWSINMLTPIFEAAGITIKRKKGRHWKLTGNGKIYTIPGKAIKNREWNNTTVIDVLLTIGNVQGFLEWVDEQQRPCVSTRMSS